MGVTLMNPKDTIDEICDRLDRIETATTLVRQNVYTHPDLSRYWAAQIKTESNAIWLALACVKPLVK